MRKSKYACMGTSRGLLVAALLGALSASAHATQRTCGTDALANTTNVLCASPSGPCTSTQVTLGANLEVPTGACTFNLGGRALVVSKTLQMTGLGSIIVQNASNITITSTGKLKARGDFVQPNGFIIGGGDVILQTSGSISHDGIVDVSGDPAGTIEFRATGSIALQGGSLIQGNGITTFYTDAQRLSDGGTVDVVSTGGFVTIDGDISATGTQQGQGGLVYLQAARDVSIRRRVDVSGGGSDGGDIIAVGADQISVTAPLTVESRGGGGSGGNLILEAGADELGGVVAGGGVTVDGVTLSLDGSASGGFGGDGGNLEISAGGPITFQGSGVAIRASAGTQYGGSGGIVTLDTQDSNDRTIGSLDGDITLAGQVFAQSSGDSGYGGAVVLLAGKALTLSAAIDVTGKDGGGDVAASSGGALSVNGTVSAQATSSVGYGGLVEMRAGSAQSAALTVAANILAFGGSSSTAGQEITLSGCALVVNNGVKIDGHGGNAGGVSGGSLVQLIARQPMNLKSLSEYLAGPGGSVRTIHPPGQVPIIGSGVVFTPARIDQTVSAGVYEGCGL